MTEGPRREPKAFQSNTFFPKVLPRTLTHTQIVSLVQASGDAYEVPEELGATAVRG